MVVHEISQRVGAKRKRGELTENALQEKEVNTKDKVSWRGERKPHRECRVTESQERRGVATVR